MIEEAARARVLRSLRTLARPRLAGTAAERELRTHVRERLGALGCAVHEEPFAYDPFWARRGFAIFLGIAAAALAAGAVAPDPLPFALVALGVALPVLLVAGTGVPRVDRRPRLTTANVVARLGRPWGIDVVPVPDILFMAHIDSKSQRISFAARSVFAALALVGSLAGLITAAAGAPEAMARGLLGAGALGLGVLAASGSGNVSPGALDNASGVAAVLELMRRFVVRAPRTLRIAAVITTAEEDGLVGADRFAEAHAAALGRSLVINLDTLGPGRGLHLVVHAQPANAGDRLVRACAAIESSAAEVGVGITRRRVPFPAGVDSHPLARRGIAALSLASGGIRDTFRHLHRPEDALERVDVGAIVRAIDVVEGAVRQMDA